MLVDEPRLEGTIQDGGGYARKQTTEHQYGEIVKMLFVFFCLVLTFNFFVLNRNNDFYFLKRKEPNFTLLI